MLLFWVIVIAGIVLLVRWAGGPRGQATPPAPTSPPDARRILDERFARGEIDEDEYRRRRDTLSGG